MPGKVKFHDGAYSFLLGYGDFLVAVNDDDDGVAFRRHGAVSADTWRILKSDNGHDLAGHICGVGIASLEKGKWTVGLPVRDRPARRRSRLGCWDLRSLFWYWDIGITWVLDAGGCLRILRRRSRSVVLLGYLRADVH